MKTFSYERHTEEYSRNQYGVYPAATETEVPEGICCGYYENQE